MGKRNELKWWDDRARSKKWRWYIHVPHSIRNPCHSLYFTSKDRALKAYVYMYVIILIVQPEFYRVHNTVRHYATMCARCIALTDKTSNLLRCWQKRLINVQLNGMNMLGGEFYIGSWQTPRRGHHCRVGSCRQPLVHVIQEGITAGKGTTETWWESQQLFLVGGYSTGFRSTNFSTNSLGG